jgi:hypothetical protein
MSQWYRASGKFNLNDGRLVFPVGLCTESSAASKERG